MISIPCSIQSRILLDLLGNYEGILLPQGNNLDVAMENPLYILNGGFNGNMKNNWGYPKCNCGIIWYKNLRKSLAHGTPLPSNGSSFTIC